jgi:hypothetical protein
MNGVKLAFQGGQKFNDQFAAVSGQQNANNQIPQQISADALLLGDYGRFEIDCSSNAVILTLRDATQIGNFTWVIYRSDSSNFQLTVVPEIVGQLINGLTEWEIFEKETFVIHAEQNKFTIN